MARKRVRALLDRLDVVLMRRQLELLDDDPGRAMAVREETSNGGGYPPAQTVGSSPAVDFSPAVSEPAPAPAPMAAPEPEPVAALEPAPVAAPEPDAEPPDAGRPVVPGTSHSPKPPPREPASRWLLPDPVPAPAEDPGERDPVPAPAEDPGERDGVVEKPSVAPTTVDRTDDSNREQSHDQELAPEVRRWLVEPSALPVEPSALPVEPSALPVEPSAPLRAAPETSHSPSPPAQQVAGHAPAGHSQADAPYAAPGLSRKRRFGGWLRRGR